MPLREKMEREVVDEVSMDELMRHTAYLAAEDRESASPGEAHAVGYFKEFMEKLGFETRIFEIENLISLPIRASLKVLSPEGREISGLTPSFSANCPHGIEGELIYLPKGRDQEVAGKIVMRDGLAAPLPTYEMEKRGAAGQVWLSWVDLPINCIVNTIWGHPTPETADRLPKTPVISLSRPDGEYLKSLCARGPVRIRLVTELNTDFMKVPLAVAEVKGVTEPDEFVLFNGHLDSWHRGASDNGTANACILEVARVLGKHRDRLRRGVRFAWWSGHSQGRYSGSTWYADHHWIDLHRHAIVHLNVDSLGCQGATNYSEVECTAEMFELGKDLINQYTGQTARYHRIGHMGDNSFWGIGLPTLFELMSRQPPEPEGTEKLVDGAAWFWHTAADTIDKIDPKILLTDTRIYMAGLWRLCTHPVLPINFVPVGEELERVLSGLKGKASGAFDLAPTMERAAIFRARAEELLTLCRRIGAEISADPLKPAPAAEALNRCLMKLSRVLMPVNYSATDPFDMDLAVPIPPLPRLQPVARLAAMDSKSHDFKFLERKMVRERNRVCYALEEAAGLIEEALGKKTV
jgi:hypothetical protein